MKGRPKATARCRPFGDQFPGLACVETSIEHKWTDVATAHHARAPVTAGSANACFRVAEWPAPAVAEWRTGCATPNPTEKAKPVG
jgi:hypothetical protein